MGSIHDTDGDDDPTVIVPKRPKEGDESQGDPRDWPAPRELETFEDTIPIPERG